MNKIKFPESEIMTANRKTALVKANKIIRKWIPYIYASGTQELNFRDDIANAILEASTKRDEHEKSNRSK